MRAIFVENEIKRALRSFRFHVLAAAFVFQGIVDPLGAKLLPKLGLLFGLSAEDVRSPTPQEVFEAYGSDSTRFVLLVFTILAMTAAADEFRRGSDSGAFVFTKGADPRSILDAKILVWGAAAFAASVAGLAVAWVATILVVGDLSAKVVAYTAVGTVLFWPLAATVVVTSASASRSAWGGFVAGLGLIGTGILELVDVAGDWMPAALLTIADELDASGSNDWMLLAKPLAGMLSLAVPSFIWARTRASAPGWD